ncbi:double zinc ribbon and ankyrin repeat-containing protein 1 [Dryobates pubescens]|uniref:double zinc ribbon and ankyrin repeat-containing protein 1 n=1 Tax=Dryobates pubescens TaxID=118200 RepID=UPI0023B9B832|nr:double zinc ribbon and ankyrin repeat-containing protein 1 [Dryobates pubescens]
MTAGSISVPQVIPLRIPLPGKAKWEIDTNTFIEIKSDTPEVSIYYTLDGSKPELIRKPGYREHNTFKYKGPIILPVGKIMVKALAVTKDCRKSTVVTKVFLVEYKQPNILCSLEGNAKNFLKDSTTQGREGGMLTTNPKKNRVNLQIKPAWSEAPQDSQDLETERKITHRSLRGPKFLVGHLEATEDRDGSLSALPTESVQFASSSAVTGQRSLASTQVSRIHRETDFLRCPQCSAPRLADPLAHFCQECGSPIPPVPVHHFPSPEGAQMAPCLECKHLVPTNTPTCIVCESPKAPQLQPQSNSCIKGKVICQVCGTGNPLHHKHCVTCESKLPELHLVRLLASITPGEIKSNHILFLWKTAPGFGGDTPPPYHGQQKETVSCSKCHRVNRCDAHFCDWCGAKPGPPPSYFACFKCGSSNQPYARFCGSCGVYIEPPSRVASPSSSPMDAGHSLGFSEAKQFQAQVAWQPLPIALPKMRAELKETEEKGTQTIGLFYPSSKLLEKKELELISQKEKLEKMSDHKPLLTAISPGKGYWRKQLDHICAHLRSYAQNNLQFRALIGEPRMGKMNSATICEGDSEVTITLNYALAVKKDTPTTKPGKFNSHDPNTGAEGRDGQHGSQTSLGKEDHYLFHPRGEIKRAKLKALAGKEEELPPESRQLLDELGPHGKGRITLVEQLLSEGADPNCTSEEDRPALTIAVLNRHAAVIPLLVQKGADIDQQSGLHNNTALHEAVLLGSEGEECIQALLRCHASLEKQNAEGQLAYDLAVTAGNDQVLSLFPSQLGQGALHRLGKPRDVDLVSV